jgi:signal transduction histidine kinase
LRLTHQDPWIAASHKARGEMFFNRNDEFFVFQLRPVGVEGSERPIGFVIADSAYRPQRHMPGLGFPDLAMTAFALNLIAGLWHIRENARSYFHLLGALPVLRHSGGRIVKAVNEFADAAGQRDPTDHDVKEKKEELLSVAIDLARAKEIVDEVRGHARDARIADLREFLLDFGRRAESRHQGRLRWSLVEPFPTVPVRMHSDDLESILFCLADNAVKHGRSGTHTTVACRVSVTETVVPLTRRKGRRLLLQIENDGQVVPGELVPFLFSDGVSTSIGDGHGTGLSSARQIAKTYGGDVIFVSANPARFGVVLEPL